MCSASESRGADQTPPGSSWLTRCFVPLLVIVVGNVLEGVVVRGHIGCPNDASVVGSIAEVRRRRRFRVAGLFHAPHDLAAGARVGIHLLAIHVVEDLVLVQLEKFLAVPVPQSRRQGQRADLKEGLPDHTPPDGGVEK